MHLHPGPLTYFERQKMYSELWLVTFTFPLDGEGQFTVSRRWPGSTRGSTWRPLADLSLFDRNLLNFHITSTRLLRPARGRIYSCIVYAQIPLRFCLISCSSFSAHDFSWADGPHSDVFWLVLWAVDNNSIDNKWAHRLARSHQKVSQLPTKNRGQTNWYNLWTQNGIESIPEYVSD